MSIIGIGKELVLQLLLLQNQAPGKLGSQSFSITFMSKSLGE